MLSDVRSTDAEIERINAEFRSLDGLPTDQRERALDLFVIKYGSEITAALRNQRIDASPNVVRLDDVRGKPLTED